jgi:hypothetical protein
MTELAPFQRTSKTSRLAAISVHRTKETQEDRVVRYVREHGGATREHIAEGLHIPLSSVCARVAAAMKSNRLSETGRTVATTYGRQAAVLAYVDPKPEQTVLL